MARKPTIDKPWRATDDDQGGFVELVVGEWLHIERMDTSHWWACIGGKACDIFISHDNRTVSLRWQDGAPPEAKP
jgi:hypothetical protein